MEQHRFNAWERLGLGSPYLWFGKGGQGVLLLDPMPAPRKFLVASTSLPMALGWGWNLCLYVGLLLTLLLLLLLLLWMLLRQLRNSVGKSILQPARSFRQPYLDHSCHFVLWKMEQYYPDCGWGSAWTMAMKVHVRNGDQQNFETDLFKYGPQYMYCVLSWCLDWIKAVGILIYIKRLYSFNSCICRCSILSRISMELSYQCSE